MGRDGCRKAGWIRIGFATLAIVDRLLLHLDLDFFLSPTNGLLPISQEEEGLFGVLSLLRFVQDSDTLLWSLHYLGLVNALLLLLGVAPRLNAFALFINTCSFHNAHWMIVDGQDTGLGPMARLYNFHLLFLPLHHITIYDGFGFGQRGKHHSAQNDTWPMWTVWLWQWETVLVFFGALLGKVAYGDRWINGTAMYYVSHCTDECIGFFNPDFMFNRALPSKIATWSALCIELVCPFTIWFCGIPRNITLVAVTMLLFGMDISMTMHTFEWYGLLGWYLFLIQKQADDAGPAASTSSSERPRTPLWRTVLDGSIFAFFLALAFNMAFPLEEILILMPQWFSEKADPFLEWNEHMKIDYAYPIACALGVSQGVWTLYTGNYGGSTNKLQVDALLTNGTIMAWRSPNWQDLGRWEHKRLYNHMSYYKHLKNCPYKESGYMCEEWENLLEMLRETFYRDVKDEVVRLDMWAEREYPPEYPENIGWWDPLRQPLIRSTVRALTAWEEEDDDWDEDGEDSEDDDDDSEDDDDDWDEDGEDSEEDGEDEDEGNGFESSEQEDTVERDEL